MPDELPQGWRFCLSRPVLIQIAIPVSVFPGHCFRWRAKPVAQRGRPPARLFTSKPANRPRFWKPPRVLQILIGAFRRPRVGQRPILIFHHQFFPVRKLCLRKEKAGSRMFLVSLSHAHASGSVISVRKMRCCGKSTPKGSFRCVFTGFLIMADMA